MQVRPHRAVLRYFAPADAFVRIALVEHALSAPPGSASLSRNAYRELVLSTCCPQLAAGTLDALRDDDDPLAARELLYQLCVEVNPQLELHTAALTERAAGTERIASARGSDSAAALRKRVGSLRSRLARSVVGQPRAIAAVSACLRRAAAGLATARRPLASFLFAGRTGVGKTELARALARELFATDTFPGLVRVDCSEFAAGHEYAKLIGAPPGYVGHDQGGYLTDALRRNPACVVLFDEIEKAHPRLHHLLLQVLDEGRLSDGRGRAVDFTQAVVCLTSNVGAHELRRARQRVGFGGEQALATAAREELTQRALAEHFAPEFLARLDERIVFGDLAPSDARAIARQHLAELARRVRERGLALEWTDAVADWVARTGFDSEHGARELGHVVRRSIEAPLAEALLSAQARPKGRLELRIARGEPRLRWTARTSRRARRAA